MNTGSLPLDTKTVWFHPSFPCRDRSSCRNWRSSPSSASWPRSTRWSSTGCRQRTLVQYRTWSGQTTNPSSWAWRVWWRLQHSEAETLTSSYKRMSAYEGTNISFSSDPVRGVVKKLIPRFGEFCYCCCSPLLPQRACNILATCEWLMTLLAIPVHQNTYFSIVSSPLYLRI